MLDTFLITVIGDVIPVPSRSIAVFLLSRNVRAPSSPICRNEGSAEMFIYPSSIRDSGVYVRDVGPVL
jgi:hypothetical protein